MKQHNIDDYELCPNCEMPLEDIEICGFCKWSRNNIKKIRMKKNE